MTTKPATLTPGEWLGVIIATLVTGAISGYGWYLEGVPGMLWVGGAIALVGLVFFGAMIGATKIRKMWHGWLFTPLFLLYLVMLAAVAMLLSGKL